MSFKAFITKTTAQAKSGVSKVSATVKLYSKKSALAEELDEMFDTLGKMSYYHAIGEGSDTAEADIQSVISEITRLRNEIDAVDEEIRQISGKKQCAECHNELQKDVSFCPHCGAKVDASTEEEQHDVPEQEEPSAETEE
ncbi:MAG: zinc ribbon domain-containing protein [Clostridia bacterium]|nr:zinc ribbon domain-containing protein [Clostridia bacterium]